MFERPGADEASLELLTAADMLQATGEPVKRDELERLREMS